jgi:hypothetical protein
VFDDGDEVRLGTGDDMILRHNGSNSFIENKTGNLILRPKTDEEGLILRADGASELYYDNSKKLQTNSTGIQPFGHVDIQSGGNLYLEDNGEVRLGNSGDLQLFHNSSTGESRVYNSNAGGLILVSDSIKLRNNANNEHFLTAANNSMVELFYDNSKKFETTADGVACSSLGTDNSRLYFLTSGHTTTRIGYVGLGKFGMDVNGGLQIRDAGNSYETMFNTISNGGVELYYNGVKHFETNAGGVKVNDGKYVGFGNGNDLQDSHDGSNSYMINGANGGNLYIQTYAENAIKCIANAAVELYYNGTKKFETYSGGCVFQGNIKADQDNATLVLGASSDLQIAHNGTDSYIDNSTGSLDLVSASNVKHRIHSDGTFDIGYQSDSVELRLGAGSDLRFYHDGSNSYTINNTANYLIKSAADIYFRTAGDEEAIALNANGAVDLFYDNSKKLETKSTGVEISGRLSVNEGGQLVNESGITADSSGNTACFRATGAAGHNPLMLWNNHTSGTRGQIQFADGSSYTSRGSITTNGSNVSYGGTSDYRLKQDDVLITDGITKVKALKPKRFKWKDNLSIGICDGFFAHEVQETAPTSGATIGTKDEVDSDGNPVYQSVDQAKLVPLLTAALQEAITKIETLETKVAALESS